MALLLFILPHQCPPHFRRGTHEWTNQHASAQSQRRWNAAFPHSLRRATFPWGTDHKMRNPEVIPACESTSQSLWTGEFAKRRKLGRKLQEAALRRPVCLQHLGSGSFALPTSEGKTGDHVRVFQRRGDEEGGAAAAPGGQREPREGEPEGPAGALAAITAPPGSAVDGPPRPAVISAVWEPQSLSSSARQELTSSREKEFP